MAKKPTALPATDGSGGLPTAASPSPLAVTRSPTIRDIAQKAGVSKSLAALALKDDFRVAAATKRRILEAAKQLGYRINPVVAHLMAQLRVSRIPAFQSNLAVVNCSRNPNIYRWHTFEDFYAGARQTAAKLGYGVDDFWLHDPATSLGRLKDILCARQIPGLVFIAALDSETLHEAHLPLWKNFACVAAGIVKTDPQIACACCDHFQTAKLAVDELLMRGYNRPGMVIEKSLDQLLDNRFSGGFLSAIQVLPVSAQIPVHRTGLTNAAPFLKWHRSHHPDCLVTLHHEVRDWLLGLGVEAPRDVGLVHLDWHKDLKGWSGMVQNNRVVGASAVDIVIQRLHANKKGAPSSPKVTMVESAWIEGPSVRPAKR